MHEYSSFVTLTYADLTEAEKTDYGHFQRFLKRLRRSNPQKIRFFSVGEHGHKSGRFHFHALLFGLKPPHQQPKSLPWLNSPWEHGYASIGQVTRTSISYTARYCLKIGEKGEENIMQPSLKPALGTDGARMLGRSMAEKGRKWDRNMTSVQIGDKYYPIDPTIRKAIREGFQQGGAHAPETTAFVRFLDYVHDLRYGEHKDARATIQLAREKYLNQASRGVL